MKSFVYIALAVFLGTVAVQGFGPPFHGGPPHGPPHGPRHGPPHGPPYEPPHGFPQRPPDWPQHRPPHEPHHGPPHGPPHHGFGPHGPPNHIDHSDESPSWDSKSDSSDSKSDSSRSDSCYDSCDSFSCDKHHSGSSDSSPSSEDSGDWHHKKDPCTKKTTTSKPTTPTPTTPTAAAPTKPTTPTDGGHTTMSPKIAKCIKSCPSTPEYNPVCGSDGKTYDNEGKLRCAKSCGVDVTLQHRSPCPQPTTPTPIPETTTARPETTPTDEGHTTMSPRIAKCIKSCPSTPEYNPVCGSDGKTYDNEGKLRCAKSCGVDVTLQRRSPCSQPTTPTPTPETTTERPEPTTADPGKVAKCIKLCPSTTEYNPVCGSDGKTYDNEGKLFCAKSCGIDVNLQRRSPCPQPTTPTPIPETTTERPETTTDGGKIAKCIKSCPSTNEYNPVCGSDGKTYDNEWKLFCAKYCGVDVNIQDRSECPKPTTPTPPEPTTDGGKVAKCIKLCPSTPEYNPVCGSDGKTYDNEGKLFCAKSCGVDVTLRRRSVCPPTTPDDGGATWATPPPTTTATTPPIGRTTPTPDFTRCMSQCTITPSFTPVCGTDLVTYMNMDRLKCAQSCGLDVEVLCEKPCAACGSKPVTTTSKPTLPPIHDVRECIRGCPVTSEYNPVCGTDQVTYSNPGRLKCAQMCGVDVAISRTGPCGLTTSSSTTTSKPTPKTLPPIHDVRECIRGCPVTSEYNPVCGTDQVTYSNPGRLKCAQMCGVDVAESRSGPCGLTTSSSTTTSKPITTTESARTTPEHDVQKCIRDCPATSEYDPVCGTDQVTYINPSRLKCAQMCGVDVAVSGSGPCDFTSSTTETPCTTLPPKILSCIYRCPATSENEPVCGTDNLTYGNMEKLYCARLCGVDVDVKNKSRCVDGNKDRLTTPLPPTTPTTKATSTTSGFTIDPNIIDEIFGKTPTEAPTTKKYNPDDDEDLDLDVRYNEAKHKEESS